MKCKTRFGIIALMAIVLCGVVNAEWRYHANADESTLPINADDENWDSYATLCTHQGQCEYYFNFTKESNLINANITFKQRGWYNSQYIEINFTTSIPIECLNYISNKLQFLIIVSWQDESYWRWIQCKSNQQYEWGTTIENSPVVTQYLDQQVFYELGVNMEIPPPKQYTATITIKTPQGKTATTTIQAKKPAGLIASIVEWLMKMVK